jgi:hypothetical protein
MTRRDVLDHLLITPAADRRDEAQWLLQFLPPYGEAWTAAKAEFARLTDPKTPELERAA